MPSKAIIETEIQRRYYSDNADKYNDMHGQAKDEHYLALAFMVAAVDFFEINSILDIGSGTGRAVAYLKAKSRVKTIVGVEPVKEMRDIGYKNGLSCDELIDGDARNLDFRDGDFDMVCAFGVLHHIRNPDVAVAEMLRVAKKAIFISDANNFGQGSSAMRTLKHMIKSLGLWKAATYIQTKGKGYFFSKEDGLIYSYSVFNNYKQIANQCKRMHMLNTTPGQINPYETASHVALLGVKDGVTP